MINDWLADQTHGKRNAEFLAQRVKIDGGLMRKILRGERPLTPKNIFKIAPVIGVPVIRMLEAAGFLTEKDISAIQKESQSLIPPDLMAALRDPEMVKIFGKLWKWKIGDPPVDLQSLCDRILSLPPDQMVLVEGLIKNMAPRTT